MPRIPVPGCACACCVDLAARIKHGRIILHGCWCHEYAPEERCDCGFCVKEQNSAKNWSAFSEFVGVEVRP